MITLKATRPVLTLLVALGLTAACDGALSSQPDGLVDGPTPPSLNNLNAQPPKTQAPPFEPASAVLPRLTNAQYVNALAELFGPALPRLTLEPDTNPYLFYSIGASTTQLSSYGVERYAESAFELSRAVFSDAARRDALIGCSISAPDCASDFIARLGRRLYRRPLTAQELERWEATRAELTTAQDPHSGLELVVAGMLQSPHFIYRVQLGQPDPQDPSRHRYTSWEMADRLSALLWDSIPDEALLDAAARDELVDDERLRAHVERMLEDPRARQSIQAFFAQYLDLKRLDDVQRDPALYPGFKPELVEDMRTEARLLVDDLVFRRDDDIRTLFSARRSFVNSALAELYEIDAPGAAPYAFVPVTFDESSPRAGILTLSAFLTLNAHPTETSPTLRGKYLRERIFCQEVPPPPDNVNLDLSEEGPGGARTLRERLEQHRSDPQCTGCHSFLDPPGYLFERFDSVGRYREQVEGLPVDSSGELNGVALNDATQLGLILAEDERLPACMVKQLYHHANARLMARSERAALDDLELEFALSGYRFKALLMALALSPGFRTVASPVAAGVEP